MQVIPVDHVTDCMDLFELVTNVKGLSSDKSQRLAIIALREDRMTRRIRAFIHVPTRTMLADGLTKIGTFENLLLFATTGRWKIDLVDGQFVRTRLRKATSVYTEDELINLDW